MSHRIGYQEAAPLYGEAGWTGVLRLDPDTKSPPPTGFTGADGIDPDSTQIEDWRQEEPNGNTALRVPADVAVIDVDDYVKNGVEKLGGNALEKLEAKWGPLPATWRCTSRDDGVSGKYFFLVPPGLKLHDPSPRDVGIWLLSGEELGIEVIRHDWRYALVWPSYNPDSDSFYVWYDPQGRLSDRVPRVDELLCLPDDWLEGLKHQATSTHRDRSVGPVWDPATPGSPLFKLLDHIKLTDLRLVGKNITARCPKHLERLGRQERVPNKFSVSTVHGGFGCWSCDYHGPLYRLVMDQMNLTPRQAQVLIRSYGVEFDTEEATEPTEDTHQQGSAQAAEGVLYAKLDTSDDPPERALEKRCITLEDAILFGLRWSEDDNAWVIPVHDPIGRLVGLQYKSDETVWCEARTPLKQNLFNYHRRPLRGQVVVVESPLDVVKLHGWGIAAVATYGATIALRQMQLLDALDIVLCLDNDPTGVSATEEFLVIRKVPCFHYGGILAKDPGEEGMTEEKFRRGLERAK